MASLARLLRREPALQPLAVAVGGGVIAALAVSTHYLRKSPDVSINKKGRPEPWNDVQQGQNTKFMSYQPDFWASRKDHPDPRAMFRVPADANSVQASEAKQHAAANAKQDTMARFASEGQHDSVQGRVNPDGQRAVEH
ncbi:hypothetical protein JCM8208_000279 [Rhodotorula glutinis]